MTKSKNFDMVEFDGIEYPVRYCEDPEREYIDKITVGTIELENVLFDRKNDLVNREAVNIDAKIYCFVPEDILKSYSDLEFQKYIDKNF